MSLKIWMPLTGTLENKGTMQPDITGSPTVVNEGKIGKCCKGIWATLTNLGGLKNYPMTISFWARTADTSITWQKICMFDDTSNSQIHGIYVADSARLKYEYNPSINVSNADPATWHHYCFVINNQDNRGYYDGVLVETNNASVTEETIGRIRIGEASNVHLNDFRIYDHALSTAEIHEIAMGLVLHYKLDGQMGGSSENLLPCGGTYTKNNPWTTTSNKTDGYFWITNSAFEAKPSTTYTISVECDGTLSSSHSQGNLTLEQKPWSFWLYISNVDTSKNWSTGQYDSPVNLTSANNNYRKIGNTHVWTYTLSSTQKYISLRTNSYSNGTDDLTLNWWNMKIEEGSNFTSWVPPINDLGIDTTIIQDSSGYNHNGITSGTITSIFNSPRYNSAINFPTANDKIVANAIFNAGVFIPECTWTGWIKRKYTDATSRYFYAGAASFGLYNDFSPLLSWTSGKIDGSTVGNGAAGGAVVPYNEWAHIAMSYKNGIGKHYINGELIKTYDYTSYGVFIAAYSNNILGNTWIGEISDARFYVTALLDTDIKMLYNVGMKVDNLGEVHSFELSQNNNNLMSKMEFARINKTFTDGLSSYTQTNCQCTLTDKGYRIYRPPNLVHDSSTMHNMWGGIKIINSTSDTQHEYDSTIDNILGLIEGHTYIFALTVEGQSSNAFQEIGANNNMGWGGGGLIPNPSSVEIKNIPTNFNGKQEVYYKFTISDSLVKTCTSAYSSFALNKQYLSYKHFFARFDYTNTGSLGTDLYITNIRLYDITSKTSKNIMKLGIIEFTDFIENEETIAKIRSDEEIYATEFIEI